MKKQLDDFQKMNLKKTSEAIHDMCYTYLDPKTGMPVDIPAKHFESILGRSVEEFLEESIEYDILNNIYSKIKFLQDEYGKDFYRSLICLAIGIKPTDLNFIERLSLNITYDYLIEKQSKEKKKFRLLNDDLIQKFDEIMNDKELHKTVIMTEYEIDEIECNQEDDYGFELN